MYTAVMVRMLFLRDIETDVQIRCRSCGHEGILPRGEMVHRFGPGYPVLSIAPHYRCSRCLSRDTECFPAPPPVEVRRFPVSGELDASRIAALLAGFPDSSQHVEPPTVETAEEPEALAPEPNPLEYLRALFTPERDVPPPVPEPEPDPFERLQSLFPPEPDEPEDTLASEPEPDPLERLQALLRPDFGAPEERPAVDEPDAAVDEDDRGLARLFTREDVDDEFDEPAAETADEDTAPFAIRDREPPPRRGDEAGEPASPQVRDAMAVLRGLVETAAGDAMPSGKAGDEPPADEPPPLLLSSQDEIPSEPRRPAREADSFENTLSKLRSLLDLDQPAPEPPPKPRGGRGLFRRHKG